MVSWCQVFWVSKGRCVAIVGSPGPLCCLPTYSRAGGAGRGCWRPCRAPWILRAPAFCPGVTYVSVRRASVHSPRLLFPPSNRNKNHRNIPQSGGSFFPAFLFLLLFLNKNQSIHRVSHCLRFLTLATAQSSPAPRPVGSKPWSQLLLF